MPLDHTAGNRQRQAQAAAPVIERGRRRVERGGDFRFVRDDDRRRRGGTGSGQPAFGNDHGVVLLLAENGADERGNGVVHPNQVALERRTRGGAAASLDRSFLVTHDAPVARPDRVRNR